MSTLLKTIFVFALFQIAVFSLQAPVMAQDVEIKIIVESGSTILKVEGEFRQRKFENNKYWRFVDSYADVKHIAARVKDLRLFDSFGSSVKFRKLANNEYVAVGSVRKFSYKIDAGVLADINSTAHVSWLSESVGLLMLNDLLPVSVSVKRKVKIRFLLPTGWRISTRERKLDSITFSVGDMGNAIFLVGKDWREETIRVGSTEMKVFVAGAHQFEDADAGKIARSILREYKRVLGGIPFARSRVFLVPFPRKVGFGRWRAETRGTNIAILSSPMAFKSQVIQRLHEQMRHEIFHLWIPKSLNLRGDYAWFYEGFAIYQALKTGVWLGQIRFEDFLGTIGQAYNLSNRSGRKFSLIDTSKRRWNGSNSAVYAKGLLVAFLVDISMLRKSRGKKDISSLFRAIYRKHNKKMPEREANESILNVLRKNGATKRIAEGYIEGSEKIDLSYALMSIGAENIGSLSVPRLQIKVKLTRREKALLKKLGYNRWRKYLRYQR